MEWNRSKIVLNSWSFTYRPIEEYCSLLCSVNDHACALAEGVRPLLQGLVQKDKFHLRDIRYERSRVLLESYRGYDRGSRPAPRRDKELFTLPSVAQATGAEVIAAANFG